MSMRLYASHSASALAASPPQTAVVKRIGIWSLGGGSRGSGDLWVSLGGHLNEEQANKQAIKQGSAHGGPWQIPGRTRGIKMQYGFIKIKDFI